MVETSDISEDELVASVVGMENGGKDGSASPYHVFEKVPASAKKKKIIIHENMFNQPKSNKEMEEYGKKM